MGQFLPYRVEVVDRGQSHELATFRRLSPACSAARMALHNPSVTLASVRDADEVMVFCTDGEREWTVEEATSA